MLNVNIKTVIPILVGLFVGCAVAGLWIALPFIFAIGIIAWARYDIRLKEYEKNVIDAEIIKIKPIIEQQAEKVGSSIGYGRDLSYHEHYQYTDVEIGSKVIFRVKWNNGKSSTITCKKGDSTYKRLYRKLKK